MINKEQTQNKTESSETKSTVDIFEESLIMHKNLKGKLRVRSKLEINTRHDLALAYTPGVARICETIAQDPASVYDLTIKNNTVAVVTDGSAVLGLGNIGPEAALPVMEGKCMLFREYAKIDAFPICLTTQDTQEIIETVRRIAPVFGGINLEDIAAPRCFEIETALQDLGIPVFHDDQHGTSITLLAALMNAAKLTGKRLSDLTIVINGAGAAGTAIAELLLGHGYPDTEAVKQVFICDRTGILSPDRPDISTLPAKQSLATLTNPGCKNGSLADALVGADVFVGVSSANCVTQAMVRSMNPDPFIFAMANPIPEIMPDDAKAAGASVVGTGRSDFNNQINNVLIFPGIFRGAINARSTTITPKMKVAAAKALAQSVRDITPEAVIPSVLDKDVSYQVAKAVEAAAGS
jgi:malate dehydrogenase (oxaloacetate-decarboxylating)